MRLLRKLQLRGDAKLRERLCFALREVEAHRKELELLRLKLEARNHAIFETALKAFQKRDTATATVFSNEYRELKKVTRVVAANELALTQVAVRLESIRDVGDVMHHVTSALKVMRKVSGALAGLLSNLEGAAENARTTLTETMSELGQISPTVSLDVESQTGDEVLSRALEYMEERTRQLQENLPTSIQAAAGATILEKAKRVALLAAGETADESDVPLFLPPGPEGIDLEEKILAYLHDHQGKLNVMEASVLLNVPLAEVESTALRLMASGKLGSSAVSGENSK